MPTRFHQAGNEFSRSGSESGYSDSSDQSRSTAPTDYSVRPVVTRYKDEPVGTLKDARDFWSRDDYDQRSMTETCSSTVSFEEDDYDNSPQYEVPDESIEVFASDAIPSTPFDFAQLFPSTRRLCIRHDDSTIDGNMNLRIDTEAYTTEGRKLALTLYHLRMHDLRLREFSLRRYSRDSGREVCHSSRKAIKPVPKKRPALQRSVTNALSSLRSKSENKAPSPSSLVRRDSGYISDLGEEDEDDDDLASHASSAHARESPPISKSSIRLEFSNYAHVDVKERGGKPSKKHDFEYWGTKYTWKRVTRKEGKFRETSYHLVVAGSSQPIAYIVPEILTTAEAEEEEAKGGWVPPCSMWISDEKILSRVTDVAESVFVVIARCMFPPF